MAGLLEVGQARLMRKLALFAVATCTACTCGSAPSAAPAPSVPAVRPVPRSAVVPYASKPTASGMEELIGSIDRFCRYQPDGPGPHVEVLVEPPSRSHIVGRWVMSPSYFYVALVVAQDGGAKTSRIARASRASRSLEPLSLEVDFAERTVDGPLLAIDDENLYVADARAVLRVPLAEGKPQKLEATRDRFGPSAIEVKGDHVYIAESDAIRRLDRFGRKSEIVVKAPANVVLALDATHAYWSGHETGLMRVSHAGGAPEKLANDSARKLALDEQSVYWSDASNGFVWKLAKSGGTPVQLAATLAPEHKLSDLSSDLAVDGRDVYAANTFASYVFRVPVAGGATEPLSLWQASAGNITLDGEYIYWRGCGNIVRLPKSAPVRPHPSFDD